MRFTLRQLEVFLAVARSESVSRAADEATLSDMSTGSVDPSSVAAAETAIGITMRTVAVLLTSWPSTAVTTKTPTRRG